jgi:Uncharacterized conserved protein, contains double-stranded beta-helix domain
MKLEFKGDSWEGSRKHEYKGNKDVVKFVLFGEEEGLRFEVRVFVIEPGGATSLEKHQHQHAVLVLEGKGSALVGKELYDIMPFDGIFVPPMTPHQFIANKGERLKILCIVDVDRDRPQRLSEEELADLFKDERIRNVIKVQ